MICKDSASLVVKVYFYSIFRDAAKKCFGACLEWPLLSSITGTSFVTVKCQWYLLFISRFVPDGSVLKSDVLYFCEIYFVFMNIFLVYKMSPALKSHFQLLIEWSNFIFFGQIFVDFSSAILVLLEKVSNFIICKNDCINLKMSTLKLQVHQFSFWYFSR